MSHNPKEAKKEMEKAIFISADCWLEVFDLLPPFQLGLGIAMISRRFDHFVDEHFKTRKWTLGKLKIERKIGPNGTKEMKIVNSDEKELPIPQIPLPKKVIGFGFIEINFIDQNVLIFLRRFDRFFATCATKLAIATENVEISQFTSLRIWPMFIKNIVVSFLNSISFRQRLQFDPSMRNTLWVVCFRGGILPEFPPDDSANASEGQVLAKWLFTPRHNNLVKVISLDDLAVEEWLSTMEQIKAAFSSASSSVSFVISFRFSSSSPIDAILPFELTNEFTQEKLTLSLSPEFVNVYRLTRCSIAAHDEGKLMKEMNELVRGPNNSKFGIFIGDIGIGNGLDDLPGPSGDQKHQNKCLIG